MTIRQKPQNAPESRFGHTYPTHEGKRQSLLRELRVNLLEARFEFAHRSSNREIQQNLAPVCCRLLMVFDVGDIVAEKIMNMIVEARPSIALMMSCLG
jgi:hypothetical protein